MISTLEHLLTRTRDASRRVIEAAAAEDIACVPSGIIAVRAGRVIVTCTLEIQSTDLALVVFDIIAKGFEPEMIAITFDAYTSRLLHDPETGRPWQPGQLAALSGFGVAMGWSTETLIIHAINRAGDVSSLHANYRRHGHRIDWTGDEIGDSSGPTVRELIDSMLEPSISHLVASGHAKPKGRRAPSRAELDEALADSMRMRLPVMLDLVE